MPKKNCEQCKKEFNVRSYQLKINKGKFCSKVCFSNWLKKIGHYKGENNPRFGKIWSDELRKKQRIAHLGQKAWNKGIKQPLEVREKIRHSLLGRKPSIEARQKMSLAGKGRSTLSWSVRGENHPNWRGGITKLHGQIRASLTYKLWLKTILLRDDFTCLICSRRGSTLNVDHIKPFALIVKEHDIKTLTQALECEELWSTENGRTLCRDCHLKTDTYGQKTKLLIKQHINVV